MARKDDEGSSSRFNFKWIIGISLWTFVLAVVISIVTENVVENFGVLMSFLTLLFVILVGIIFDIVGIAVTSAEEKPFHAMAANKIDEAKFAIQLVRNAEKVSNFCNDVIGDICGIISGGIGATLIFNLVSTYGFKDSTALTILLTGLTASFTVGGKAMGKTIAIYNYEKIIFQTSKLYFFMDKYLGMKFFTNKKKNMRG